MNSGCSDSSTDLVIDEPKIDQSRFIANVSGSVQGEISGAGIVTYLPPRERDPVTRIRPGYFLIANINSDKSEQQAFIIIFRIPDNARPGNYNLVTPDPLKVGERFDVRVETAAKGKSIVYQANTEGTITLEKFSPDQTDSAAKNITGTFQFVTENSQRGQIAIQGRFDLPLERKPVSQNIVHSVNDEVKG